MKGEPGTADRRRFARLRELFHEVEVLSGEARSRRLAEVESRWPELHAELLELVGDGDRPPGASGVEGGARALDRLARLPTAQSPALDPAFGVSALDAVVDSGPEPLVEGDTVGPYRLVRILGEGGMGRVWQAEQLEPVRRTVALKVLRGGPGAAALMARFEAERRTLAIMDHPHIARILDAGTTPGGQPWFAMERVEGEPITAWADRHGLGALARLELFLPVCDALRHAHMKGIIHRDLKPSNILVAATDDGRPAVKIIDFGIAKAIDEPLLAGADATRLGEIVGTPEYMSPEQASLGAVDVDTRSDVYGLGLVLFELLVGGLPLPAESLRDLTFDEVCRRIREHEAPRPSSRIRARAATADGRRPAPEQAWSRRLRKDLDAVLLKALATDRDRRYGSVDAFADDLRRVLADEPVSAAPPSRAYRLSKFVRRHRAAVSAALVAAAALTVGLIAAVFGLLEAREAQAAAEAARGEMAVALRTAESATSFTVDLFRAADPRRHPTDEPTARDLLERGLERVEALGGEPRVEARLLDSLSEISLVLGDYDRAEELVRRALEAHRAVHGGSPVDAEATRRRASLLHRLGDVHRRRQENPQAIAVYRHAIALLSRHHAESPEMGRAMNDLAIVLNREEDLDEAIRLLERSIELAERHEPQPSEAVASALTNLATAYHRSHRPTEAVATLHRALELSRSILPVDHPDFAVMLNNLAFMARSAGQLGAAARYSAEGLALDRRVLGDLHPDVAHDLQGMGLAWYRLGRIDAAEAAFAEGLEIHRLNATSPYQENQLRFWLGLAAAADNRFGLALERLDAARDGLAQVDARVARLRTVDLLVSKADALRHLGRPQGALAAADEGLVLGDAIDYRRSRARLLLVSALARLDTVDAADAVDSGDDRNDGGEVSARFEEALREGRCTPDAPCLLDAARNHVIRAHWHARRGDLDRAIETLELAIEHDGWSAWMLDDPDLEPLRADPRWPRLVARLDARLEAELAVVNAEQ